MKTTHQLSDFQCPTETCLVTGQLQEVPGCLQRCRWQCCREQASACFSCACRAMQCSIGTAIVVVEIYPCTECIILQSERNPWVANMGELHIGKASSVAHACKYGECKQSSIGARGAALDAPCQSSPPYRRRARSPVGARASSIAHAGGKR